MKKTIYKLLLVLLAMSPSAAFAEDTIGFMNSIIEGTLNTVTNSIGFAVYQIAIHIVNLVLTGMLGLGFLVSSIIDAFLIQVPDLSSIINSVSPQLGVEAGSFLQNAFFTATMFMLIISIGLWLFMGGFQYMKVALANINQTARDDDERKMGMIKFTFKMIFALITVALIPMILKVLFYILFIISILLFKMGIAPLGFSDADTEKDLLFKYPITSIYMIATNIDGKERKEILTNFNANIGLKDSFGKNISIYVGAVQTKVLSILLEASEIKLNTLNQSGLGTQIAGFSKAAFYVAIIFMFLTITMKIFTMLITRFVSIIIHSVFIPLNVAMLGSPYVEKIGLRSMVSYFGSLLITPIIFAIAGFGITILLTFKTNILVGLYANAATDVYLYGSLMAILGYGLFTFMYQVSQNFGSELENILLGYSGRSGYDSSSDVSQGMASAKQYLGLSAVQQKAGGFVGSTVGFAGAKSASALGIVGGGTAVLAGKLASTVGLGGLGGKIEKSGSSFMDSQMNSFIGNKTVGDPGPKIPEGPKIPSTTNLDE